MLERRRSTLRRAVHGGILLCTFAAVLAAVIIMAVVGLLNVRGFIHAWRAQRRLHRRYHRLCHRMPSQKAVTAVARELVGFLWAVLQADPRYLNPKAA